MKQYNYYNHKETFEGDTREELFMQMYSYGGMTFEEIGKTCTPKITRSAVHLAIKTWAEQNSAQKQKWTTMKKRQVYHDRIENLYDNGMPTKDIISAFYTKPSRTLNILKKLYPPSVKGVLNPEQRLNNIVKSIWPDRNLQAGSNFEFFIKSQLYVLNNYKQIENIETYYFEQLPTDRFRRGTALRKFSKIIRDKIEVGKLDVVDLIDNEVLIET